MSPFLWRQQPLAAYHALHLLYVPAHAFPLPLSPSRHDDYAERECWVDKALYLSSILSRLHFRGFIFIADGYNAPPLPHYIYIRAYFSQKKPLPKPVRPPPAMPTLHTPVLHTFQADIFARGGEQASISAASSLESHFPGYDARYFISFVLLSWFIACLPPEVISRRYQPYFPAMN